MMKKSFRAAIGGSILSLLLLNGLTVQGENTRVVRLKQDDAQVEFVSKIYELKNLKTSEILPFIRSAVTRYNVNSTVGRVNYSYGDDSAQMLLVSTGRDFMPYVDELVALIDQPGTRDANGALIEGTGLGQFAYQPKYRAASEFLDLINVIFASGMGRAYANAPSNTLIWSDEVQDGEFTRQWVEIFDRPAPQVAIRLNYYEVRSSTLRDVGFDYLAWKNGPGVNFFNVGYNAGRLAVDEVFKSVITAAPVAADFAKSWGYGGFFTAPSIDMSFLRMLQQSGHASLAADGELTVISTPVSSLSQWEQLSKEWQISPETAAPTYSMTLYPEYQNIAKTNEGRSFIGASFYTDENQVLKKRPPELEISIHAPLVCLAEAAGELIANDKIDFTRDPEGGSVIFDYRAKFSSVVERGNTGSELSNGATIKGSVTLGFENEEILTVYEKTDKVKQVIGLPVLCKIPVLKYLFSTTTTLDESTYIIVTAEAVPVNPAGIGLDAFKSRTAEIGNRD